MKDRNFFIQQVSALLLQVLIFVSSAYAQSNTAKQDQDCISCHQNEVLAWQQSDHAKSMALANSVSVKGDFNNQTVQHYGQKARFFMVDNQYRVTISYDNKTKTYPVKYSFGHYPLQQYLVETQQGHLQVLPFAWDSRGKEKGGQRWYHNYSNEEIRPEDRLHWRQPLQNWNGMCADCHSDGLIRNYNSVDNSFNSKFDNINVGCFSCHGDMSSHSAEQQATNKTEDVDNTPGSVEKQSGHWVRNQGEKTAKWQGNPRDNSFMETCFACHSLRSPLTDGIVASKPYLDQFTPQALFTPLYHADGQISEEVYVYGSFLQSKMFAAGVNCMDCHEKHSMKLKAEGNGLCLQCHAVEAYNVKTHHHHPDNTIGAQCTSCHMPDERFMGVDDRSDHGFKIPRPDIAKEFNTPDVCIKCHQGRTSTWSENQLKEWFGQPGKISTNLRNYYQLQTGTWISLEQHSAIIADENISVITRATALQLLNRSTNRISSSILNLYLTHSESLLRLSAAMVANLITDTERAQSLAPLLQDSYKAVRIAAARNLVNISLTDQQKSAFDRAFKELTLAMDINSWRGEGRANRAVMEVNKGNWNEAENSLLAAIKIDPYFESGYLNLAEVYRHQNKINLESQILEKAHALFPKSAEMQYAFGLHLVRQKQYHKATLHFKRAVSFAPEVEQYAYAYILSLDGEGKTREALDKLREIIHRYREAEQLNQLGDYLYRKSQSSSDRY